MRQLGTVQDERAAYRFADYLLTKGMPISVEPGHDGYKLWVRNEDQLDAARREFGEFTASPDAPIYQESARTADQIRAEEERRSRQARKNVVKLNDRWRKAGSPQRAPITIALMVASIIVGVWTNLGKDLGKVAQLTIAPIVPVGENAAMFPPVDRVELWTHEPWRLLTPIFLHFSIWHILFNMIMLWQLGLVIEMLRGSWRMAILALLIAVSSNLGQYLWTGSPFFGGMSGVVFGLFGYVWMKSRYEPGSGFFLAPNSVVMILGWFVLCVVGIIPNVANIVHGVGLVVGVILGRWRSAWQRLQ
jgi:GlpG protein